MKRIIIAFFLGLTTIYTSAQDILTSSEEISDSIRISPEDSIFNAAENGFIEFFRMQTNPASDKQLMYGGLMETFKNYFKSIEPADEARKAVIKEKIRKIHPFMEEAGIHYSQAGNQKTAYEYIKCFLNIPHMPMFVGERFMRSSNYPTLVLFAATEAYNAKELAEAVTFFQEYLDLGEKHRQETCYSFMAQALEYLEEYDREERILEEGLMNYPNNNMMLRLAINSFSRSGNTAKAKEYLDRAIALNPTDPELMFRKALIFDSEGKYLDALNIYNTLLQADPNSLQLIEKQALCYYNIGGTFINESNRLAENLPKEKNKSEAGQRIKGLRDEAIKNLNLAVPLLQQLASSVKNNTKYLTALADAYLNLGNEAEAKRIKEQMNNGGIMLADNSSNDMTIPNFNNWAVPLINADIEKWAKKDTYETTEEFKKRVNSESRAERIVTKRKSLEEEFIAKYGNRYDLKNITLKPYDADHETFKIQTKQGDIYLQVPRANDEARKFEQQWHSVTTDNPKFAIDKDGNMVLSEVIFTLGNGSSYIYDARKDLSYGQAVVTVQFDDVEAGDIGSLGGLISKGGKDVTTTVVVGESDVDLKIPETNRVNDNTCALIICNEDYKNTGAVAYAKNDGSSFFNYCIKTLGIPGTNIYMQENATGGDMAAKIDMVKNFIASRAGEARVIVYYSGHGLPDQNTGEAYLLPVDAYPKSLSTCYKLSNLYAQLGELPSKSVTVFIDACFSGAQRDGDLMDTAARGVAIKAKKEAPKGNMVVFTACTGDETAYPYENQKHGMFTYFLLKKLQETKGRASYEELAEYITKNVSQNSLKINSKPQNPTVTSSANLSGLWEKWQLDREK